MEKTPSKTDYQALENLYASEGDSGTLTPEQARLDQPKRSWRRVGMFIFLGLALLSSAVWAWFYLGGTNSGGASEITVDIRAPEVIPVGEPLEYEVKISNNSTTPLVDVALRLNYADSFRWGQATPSPVPPAHNTWELGSLAVGDSTSITVHGALFGEAGGIRTLQGIVTYRLENFRTELERNATASTKLEPSLVRLAWEGPADSKPGESADYKLTYEHLGTATLPASILTINVPLDLKITSTDPKTTSEGVARWELPALAPKDKGSVSLKTIWGEAASGDQILEGRLEVSNEQGGIPLLLNSLNTSTRISRGDVTLDVTVNGSATPLPANPGATLHYELTYENSSDRNLEDAEVRVRFDSGPIDWKNLVLTDGGTLEGTSLVWSSKKTPALAKVLAESKGVLRWDLPLLSNSGGGAGSLLISSTPSFQHTRIDGDVSERTYEGSTLTVPINGQPVLDVSGRYFSNDGEAVGSGSLPPKVGSATTYQITWRLSNSAHDLTGVRITANLPANVTIATNGQVQKTTGQWQVVKGQPEWAIDRVEAGLAPEVSFLVTLSPTSADAGKIVVLSGRTTLQATDATTGGNVVVTGSVATTGLEGDSVAKDKGVVEP